MGFFKTVKRGIEREHIKQRLKSSERKRYKEEIKATEEESYKKEEMKQAKLTGAAKAKRVGKKAREPKKGFGSMGIGLRKGIGKGASPLGATSFMPGGFAPSGMTGMFGSHKPMKRKVKKRSVKKKPMRKEVYYYK